MQSVLRTALVISTLSLALVAGEGLLSSAPVHAESGSGHGGDGGGSGSDGGSSGSDGGGHSGSDDGGGHSGSDDGGGHSGSDDGGGRSGSDDGGGNSGSGSSNSGRGSSSGGDGNAHARPAADGQAGMDRLYSGGWRERIARGRYQVFDPDGRSVVDRAATAKDRARFSR